METGVETPKIRMILLVVDSNHGHEHAACAAKMGHLMSLSRYLDPYPVHVLLIHGVSVSQHAHSLTHCMRNDIPKTGTVGDGCTVCSCVQTDTSKGENDVQLKCVCARKKRKSKLVALVDWRFINLQFYTNGSLVSAHRPPTPVPHPPPHHHPT